MPRVLSYDIETYNPKGEFTRATNPSDCIHCISWAVRSCPADGPTRVYSAVLGQCPEARKNVLSPLPGFPDLEVCVVAYPTEGDLIRAFIDAVTNEHPDVITGYNINGFDTPYVLTRAQLALRVPVVFPPPGTVVRDMVDVIRSITPPGQSCKLVHATARHFPDGHFGKLDMPIPRLFSIHEDHMRCMRSQVSNEELDASWSQVLEVAEYCTVDALLPLELARVLGTFDMPNSPTA